MNIADQKRLEGMPCGIKNIGNTCYINSILQMYYNLPNLVNAVMESEDDGKELTPAMANDPKEAELLQRLKASRNLIKSLQVFFAQMAIGDKKYVDSSEIVKYLTWEDGRQYVIRDQDDIG